LRVSPQGDAGGALKGEAVNAGTDGGEGEGLQAIILGQNQAVAVTAGQQLVLMLLPPLPGWSDGVNDMSGWQPIALGHFCLTGGAALLVAACVQKFRASRAVDGAGDPAAAKQVAIGGIDDCIDSQMGDVILNDFNNLLSYGLSPQRKICTVGLIYRPIYEKIAALAI